MRKSGDSRPIAPCTDNTIVEAVDYDHVFKTSWLVIAKTLKGYVVYQNHPAFHHDDRVPRPLAVFETKKALIEWMAAKWIPELPDYERIAP
jgi:hypothetical protein